MSLSMFEVMILIFFAIVVVDASDRFQATVNTLPRKSLSSLELAFAFRTLRVPPLKTSTWYSLERRSASSRYPNPQCCYATRKESFPSPDSPDNLTDDANRNDWLEAELTLLNFPFDQPDPALEPLQILQACCRSLQFVDHPTPLAGLARLFPFLTWECRKTVTARMGGDSVERFMKYGERSPALQPFMGATRLEWGEGTHTPATLHRGELISFPVAIHGSSTFQFQHSSGFIRPGISDAPPVTEMVVRMERERRPPLQGCWLIREVLDVRYAFAGDMGNAGVGS